jgi:serine beta-lactamase-like protein LACTB
MQDGKIDIDSPVTKYVPNYPNNTITPRLLASHLSGIRHYKDKTEYMYMLIAL